MSNEPVVCTLLPGAVVDRSQEWRRLLDDHVVEVVRTGGSARLRLRDTEGSVLAATDLARREKACCAFFEFQLTLEPEAVWLTIDAPAEASAVLDGLIAGSSRR